MRQDYLVTRKNFITMKVNKDKDLGQFFTQQVTVSTASISDFKVQDPMLDLCPLSVFKQLFGKMPGDYRIPTVELNREGGPLKGVLVWANQPNCPMGWKRIIVTETFQVSKVTLITTSNDILYENEISDVWSKHVKLNTNIAGCVAKPKDTKSKDAFDVPDHLFSCKKNAVLNGFDALKEVVSLFGEHAQAAAEAKAAKVAQDASATATATATGGSHLAASLMIGSAAPDAATHAAVHPNIQELHKQILGQQPDLSVAGPCTKPPAPAKRAAAPFGVGAANQDAASKRARADTTSTSTGAPQDFTVYEAAAAHALGENLQVMLTAPRAIVDIAKQVKTVVAELMRPDKCDLVKLAKLQGLGKKIAGCSSKLRNKAGLAEAVAAISELFTPLEQVINQNAACMKIEKAAKQNTKRRDEAARDFDSDDAVEGILLLEEMRLYVSATIYCRLHVQTLERIVSTLQIMHTWDMITMTEETCSLTELHSDDTSDGMDESFARTSRCLSLFSMRNRGVDEALLHGQQQADVASILQTVISKKFKPDVIKAFCNFMPVSQLNDDVRDQRATLLAFADPEAAGEEAVRVSLARMRFAQNTGVYFALRFFNYGQSLKADAATWLSSQVSSSLSKIRIGKLLSDALSYTIGADSDNDWATLCTNVFAAISACRGEPPSDLSECASLIERHLRNHIEAVQREFDELIHALFIGFDNGKLTCDSGSVPQAKLRYTEVTQLDVNS